MSTLLDRNKTLDADDIARGVARLDDETILQSLRDRYFVSAIYSSVNSMLIAINPYEELGLYTQAKLEEYATLGGDTVPAPHAFGIAAAAFKGLLAGGSQSIVITGESGAGKTETAKRMLQFLAHMAGAHAPDPSLTALPPPSLDSKSPAALHLLLLRTNAVLEAFGNAHTTMNDNSSRFGKFLSVQYDASAKLLGAQLNTYLLEKTRCTARGPGECTFHVLYMLLLGTPPSEAGQLELKPDFQAYRTTRVQAASARQLAALVDPSGRDGASWSAQLAEVRSVLTDAIGLGSADVWSLLQLLGCVVHCGSVDFATPASGQTSTGAALNDGALRPLRALARLLGVDASKLCDALTTRVIRAGTEFVAKPNTHAEASALCDALGKALYARVFDDVVRSINGAVGLSRPGAPTRGTPAHAFIGILDIFGFERFERNSLEQLLINFTNEHLQSLFNRIVFTAAQAEAAHEGVDTSAFGESQVDNREVLHLFGAERYGLIASLNEECIFPKGTDESFVAKLRHANGRNPRLVDDSSNARADPKRTFSVRHFAGDVLYAADGFLLKNKDPFSEDLAALLRASAEPTVARLFAPPTAEKSAAVRSGAFQKLVFKGVAVQFEAQLQRLLRVLAAGNVHFVRCVKPNNDKKPRAFDDARVLDQLRCGGVTEAIRVFAAGFPDRVPFDAFCARYGPLVAEGAREARPPSAEAARALLGALGVAAGEFALGSSKVFCKGGLIQRLELRREQLLKVHAVRCQAAIRGMLARSRARALRAAAREHAARRQRAEDSERRLREMEEAAEVERAREREAALAAHAAGRAAAADAARAAADSAAAARAHEAHAAAELIASKRRAAELEVELTSARAQLGASGATPTPAADSAVRGASAEAEVVELRLQLARALAQLQREKEDGASYRAEAEGTNARWQGEARRCDAELKRQLEQREAERRVHADRADELRWELAFWKGEMELHWLRDVDTRRKPKEADKAGRGLGGFVVDAFKSVAQQLGAKASLASKPAAAAAERAGQARAPDPLREVNPTCRQPSAAEALEPAGSTQRLVVSATSVSKAAVRAAGAGVVRAARYQPETYGGRWSVEVLEFAEYMGTALPLCAGLSRCWTDGRTGRCARARARIRRSHARTLALALARLHSESGLSRCAV
jgi:myosin heavy subunit